MLRYAAATQPNRTPKCGHPRAQPSGDEARRQAAAILFSRGQCRRDDGGMLRPCQTIQATSAAAAGLCERPSLAKNTSVRSDRAHFGPSTSNPNAAPRGANPPQFTGTSWEHRPHDYPYHRWRGLCRLSVGAKLFFLPKYSPDLNPIEQVFAKLKHFLRKAAARTVEAVCLAIGEALQLFTTKECASYLANSGYGQT
jgi:hypothetical protein